MVNYFYMANRLFTKCLFSTHFGIVSSEVWCGRTYFFRGELLDYSSCYYSFKV
jgi:hypothetical protein